METKIYHDEILGTDCPCDICEELAEVHNIAMEGVETRREVAQNLLDTFDPAEGE